MLLKPTHYNYDTRPSNDDNDDDNKDENDNNDDDDYNFDGSRAGHKLVYMTKSA